jgi:hypothetical protein
VLLRIWADQEVVDAGAELVLFTPFFDDDASQMERLAHDVIPRID